MFLKTDSNDRSSQFIIQQYNAFREPIVPTYLNLGLIHESLMGARLIILNNHLFDIYLISSYLLLLCLYYYILYYYYIIHIGFSLSYLTIHLLSIAPSEKTLEIPYPNFAYLSEVSVRGIF